MSTTGKNLKKDASAFTATVSTGIRSTGKGFRTERWSQTSQRRGD